MISQLHYFESVLKADSALVSTIRFTPQQTAKCLWYWQKNKHATCYGNGDPSVHTVPRGNLLLWAWVANIVNILSGQSFKWTSASDISCHLTTIRVRNRHIEYPISSTRLGTIACLTLLFSRDLHMSLIDVQYVYIYTDASYVHPQLWFIFYWRIHVYV